MKKIKKIILLLILSIAIISCKNTSQAVLQANGGAATTRKIDDWMLQIRQMETDTGALGLKETINSTGLLATSESNNLDIHMQKNTEYGALALLSASSYGKPDKVNSGETTTGNKSGVYMYCDSKEWVAAGTLGVTKTYKQANPRYKNLYTDNYVAKPGDAITETNRMAWQW